MSAYLEWLQKQEHKVRRPAKPAVTTTESFTSAASRLSSSSATIEVDLAEESDAYRAWRQRRGSTLPTAQTTVSIENDDDLRAPPARNSKTVIADAVSKYSLLSKVATDSRKRPLPSVAAVGVSSARAATSTRPPVAAVPSRPIGASSVANVPTAKKVGTAVSRGFVSVRTRENSNSSSRSSSVERIAKSHARKRAIDDVEAPSKPTSLPSKQQKVDAPAKDAAAGKRANGSVSTGDDSSDKDLDASEEESPVMKPKKRTPLDEALAKIDEKYGSLVPLVDLSSQVAHAAYLPDERARIQEVRFWSDVDRFASL